jgi:hypothetical protein
LAISEETWADYTTFVTGVTVGYYEKRKIYIVDALERKMNFVTTVETLKAYYEIQKAKFGMDRHDILVETVGYQEAMAQYLRSISDIRIE